MKKMKNILIVGENNNLLDMLSSAIVKHADEYEVLTAEDSDQAVRILRERPVDVLLTDIKMPDMTGSNRLISSKMSNSATHIIRMSADDIGEVGKKAESAFISESIKKPVTIDSVFTGIPRDRRSFLWSLMGPYR
jgi:DNA-binding NtrC family response regulator